jgi:hypothetical protein
VVFDEHWRWHSAEPTADELLVPATRDGSSPVPAEWRHPVQERQTKEAKRSAAPAQIEPVAADQGGPPGGEAHAEAEPQHHDDMPALVDSSDDELTGGSGQGSCNFCDPAPTQLIFGLGFYFIK